LQQGEDPYDDASPKNDDYAREMNEHDHQVSILSRRDHMAAARYLATRTEAASCLVASERSLCLVMAGSSVALS
jgi:hypothetical protein